MGVYSGALLLMAAYIFQVGCNDGIVAINKFHAGKKVSTSFLIQVCCFTFKHDCIL